MASQITTPVVGLSAGRLVDFTQLSGVSPDSLSLVIGAQFKVGLIIED